MALTEQLATIGLLRDLTADQLAALGHALGTKGGGVRLQTFRPGEKICSKGEYQLELCLLLAGQVDLYDDVVGVGWSKVATLSAGGFFGELGAIGGLPRTTDVVASDTVEMLFIARHALKLVEVNPRARQILSERYRELAIRVIAAQHELFENVPRSFIDALISQCEIQRLDLRGIHIVAQGETAAALYIVRDGFVQVVHEREDGSKRVLAYLRPYEYFGEMALFDPAQTRYASVLSAGKCELIKVPYAMLRELCRQYPQAEQSLRATVERRHKEEEGITAELSDLLERSGQLGIIQSDALLVMDMDLCVNCDNCVKACESVHGKSRLNRSGIRLGKYLVPSACRHCDDPKCMNSCPTGAIKRRSQGEIYFQYDMCIGCGNCAIACPYDNIAMIDTPTFDHAQARKARTLGAGRSFFRPYPMAAHDAGGLWERISATLGLEGRSKRKPIAVEPQPEEHAHVPAAFPIKCDLCDGLPFMACVHSCPTGAAIRIDPAQLFRETGAVSPGSRVSKAKGGSD